MGKLNYFVFFILINTIGLTATAQNIVKKQNTVKITGAALLNNIHIEDYSVSIYLDGTRMDSIYTKSKSPIKMVLPCNQVFTLLFQKQNCFDKIVIVNTKTPSSLKKNQELFYAFEVEMIQTFNESSVSFEDYKVAVLMINDDNKLSETPDDAHQKSKIDVEMPENLFPVSKNIDK